MQLKLNEVGAREETQLVLSIVCATEALRQDIEGLEAPIDGLVARHLPSEELVSRIVVAKLQRSHKVMQAVRVTFVGQNQLVALQLRHDAVARDYDVRICARWNTAGCPDNKRLRHMQTDLVAQRGRIGFVALIRRAISKRLVHRTIRTIDGAARNLIGPVELSIGKVDLQVGKRKRQEGK